jgi:hypothetical protein
VNHDDRITIGFEPPLGRQIRALARRRGLTVAAYCRLMCSLEVMGEPTTETHAHLLASLHAVQTAHTVLTSALSALDHARHTLAPTKEHTDADP